MLLKAEFLSIVLVLVYVGAVMVLFLFVVMMIDVKVEGLRVGFWSHFPLAALVGVVIALEMVAVLMGGFRTTDSPEAINVAASGLLQASNTKELGILMYTKYIYPLEVATAILLVAMIAAIALTLRTRKDTKYTNPSDQVRVKARNRMTVLKMSATSTAVDQAPVASNVEAKV
jgi:NADH-quinone oxidoreductase subunit J